MFFACVFLLELFYLGILNRTVIKQDMVDTSEVTSTNVITRTSTEDANDNDDNDDHPPIREEDIDCPFRNSSLYRSIYIYEHPNKGPTYMRASSVAKDTIFEEWPWIKIQEDSIKGEYGHYAMGSQMDQYTLEIIILTLFTHPDSCLRSYDPESAKLFHVPFLNSVHFHTGKVYAPDYSTTSYAKAMMDAMDQKYDTWETVWGITNQYWKRNNGADHISIMAEPLHGFWHPRSKRGNYHFVHSQYQLKPHIVISLELSTTFVNMYPKCAAKNIVVPYPNPDGRHYNGAYDQMANKRLQQLGMAENAPFMEWTHHAAPYPSDLHTDGRPIGTYYSAGSHGECSTLRKAMQQDWKCSDSGQLFHTQLKQTNGKILDFYEGMRLATFCPCPGGDSPSAKRMYDAAIAGCIPVILSHDFVWGLSTDFDPESSHIMIEPESFSIRLSAADFDTPQTQNNCNIIEGGFTLDSFLTNVSPQEIARLRKGLKHAKYHYSFYSEGDDVPINTLKENVLPTGGASYALIKALEERAGGARWNACAEELATKPTHIQQPMRFKC